MKPVGLANGNERFYFSKLTDMWLSAVSGTRGRVKRRNFHDHAGSNASKERRRSDRSIGPWGAKFVMALEQALLFNEQQHNGHSGVVVKDWMVEYGFRGLRWQFSLPKPGKN
jgi:ribosomal protein L3